MPQTSPPPKKVPRTSMCERAYQYLKQQIVTNELPLGTQINDLDIAERLQISRTPIREALLLLHREGFVEVTPRRGIRVLPLSIEDMREVYDIITALETLAVGLVAARRPTAKELQPLRDAIRDMETALRAENLSDWTAADERFHRTLLELSGNRRLVQAGQSYRDVTRRAHMVVMKLRPLPVRSVKAHAELIEFLRRGDVEGSRRKHYEQRIRGGDEHMAAVMKYGLKSL
jgi:DNA-binding GntR family transcriptional regulator